MKKFLSVLYVSFCLLAVQVTFGQSNIYYVNSGRYQYTWNEKKEDWNTTNKNSSFNSIFIFYTDKGYIKHINGDVSTSYTIKGRKVNAENTITQLDVETDKGVRYTMIVNLNESAVFLNWTNEKVNMIRYDIGASFVDNDTAKTR
jgi:hypothetical protein